MSKKWEKKIEYEKILINETLNSNPNKNWIKVWKPIFKIEFRKIFGNKASNSSSNKKILLKSFKFEFEGSILKMKATFNWETNDPNAFII